MPILQQCNNNENNNINHNKFYILPQYRTYTPSEAGKYNILSCNTTNGGKIAFLKIIVGSMDKGSTASVYVVIDGVECRFQFSYPSTAIYKSNGYYFMIGDNATGEGIFRYGYLTSNGKGVYWSNYIESNVSSGHVDLIPCDFENGSTSQITVTYSESSSRKSYGVPVFNNECCVYFKNNIEIFYDRETSSTGISIYFGVKYSGDITVTTENLVEV